MSESEKEGMTTAGLISLFNYYAVGFEDGGRGHKLRNAGGHEKLAKAKQWISPLGPSEGT